MSAPSLVQAFGYFCIACLFKKTFVAATLDIPNALCRWPRVLDNTSFACQNSIPTTHLWPCQPFALRTTNEHLCHREPLKLWYNPHNNTREPLQCGKHTREPLESVHPSEKRHAQRAKAPNKPHKTSRRDSTVSPRGRARNHVGHIAVFLASMACVITEVLRLCPNSLINFVFTLSFSFQQGLLFEQYFLRSTNFRMHFVIRSSLLFHSRPFDWELKLPNFQRDASCHVCPPNSVTSLASFTVHIRRTSTKHLPKPSCPPTLLSPICVFECCFPCSP